MFTPYILAAGFAALIAAIVILPLRDARRLRLRLRREFGARPERPEGLAGAERFFAAHHAHAPAAGIVDDLTWLDLDMDEVFGELNACKSAVGDARLYTVLRSPRAGGQAETLARREALIGHFDTDSALRDAALYTLARLGRAGGQELEAAIYHAGSLSLPHPRALRLMAAAPLLSLLFVVLSPPHALFAAGVLLLLNFAFSAQMKAKNEAKFLSVRYLASALACARRLADLMQKNGEPELAKALRAAAAPFASFGPAILLLNYNDLCERSLGFDVSGAFLLPLLCYQHIVERLGGKSAETLALYTRLGEVDLALCVLSWRQTLPQWCRPRFTGGEGIAFERLCHPLLDEPVPATASFERDVLLTGSNASGKSTFIKAVGLNCLLAQTLYTCTAAAFSLRAGPVATSMAVADSVVDGDSYFVAEIKSMRRLVRMAGGNEFCWFFIDEILKGTNTAERIAASAAVLRALAAAPCRVFAATHDTELTAMMRRLYDNYHFRESVTEAGVHFDYQLRPGPATTRNAILLLERMAFPAEITAEARALVDRFEASGEWGTAE